MPEFDPLADLGPKNPKVNRDVLQATLRMSDSVTYSDYQDLTGSARRIHWRPPVSFIKRAAGTVYSDSRGHILRYDGFKVTFINKTGVNLTVRGNVPMGRVTEPEMIYTRAENFAVNLAPRGSTKEATRKSKKQTKVYTKSTDRFAVNFRSAKYFKADPNVSCPYVEKVPGDDVTVPTYKADAYVLLDFLVITPTDSQYTGTAIPAEQELLDVNITVHYRVTDTNPDDGGEISSVQPIYMASLASIGAMEFVDYYDYSIPAVQMSDPVARYVTLPAVYPQIGIHGLMSPAGEGREGAVEVGALYYYHNGKAISPVRQKNLEARSTRLQVNINAVTWPGSEAGFDSAFYQTLAGSLEFGYDDEMDCWLAVDNEGRPKQLNGINKEWIKTAFVSSSAPVLCYKIPDFTLRKLSPSQEKMLKNGKREFKIMKGSTLKTLKGTQHLGKHEKFFVYSQLRYSITFDQISSVITKTIRGIKMVTGVLEVLGTLFL